MAVGARKGDRRSPLGRSWPHRPSPIVDLNEMAGRPPPAPPTEPPPVSAKGTAVPCPSGQPRPCGVVVLEARRGRARSGGVAARIDRLGLVRGAEWRGACLASFSKAERPGTSPAEREPEGRRRRQRSTTSAILPPWTAPARQVARHLAWHNDGAFPRQPIWTAVTCGRLSVFRPAVPSAGPGPRPASPTGPRGDRPRIQRLAVSLPPPPGHAFRPRHGQRRSCSRSA